MTYRPSEDPIRRAAHARNDERELAIERDGYFPGIPRIAAAITPPPPTIGPDEEDDDDGMDDDHQ